MSTILCYFFHGIYHCDHDFLGQSIIIVIASMVTTFVIGIVATATVERLCFAASVSRKKRIHRTQHLCHELRVELSLDDQQSKRTQAFRRIVQGLGCSAQGLGVRVHSKPTVL